MAVSAAGAEAASDGAAVESPETYVGYDRAERFASPGGAVPDADHDYATPVNLTLNQWALAGRWVVQNQQAVSSTPRARIVHRFHARDLHLVLGPGADGKPVRFRVTMDGHAPGASHGVDTDTSGAGTVTDHRLYQLIRQQGPLGDHTFEIEFLDAGAQAYAFTFG